AECHAQKIIDLSDLNHLSNQEIIDMLIKIKGIGVWSAQMF
ncbi:MAG TPA: cysteine methyltransferase, partial [Acholeplasmataceae bacterium]|nr:cysteine methyltransferase [Acholeplasmataceae bacterium]